MKHIAYPQLHERMIQVCAHLARACGGNVGRMKLMKLAYLSDRLALERLEHPVSYDDYRKLQNGPAACDIQQGLYGKDASDEWRQTFGRTDDVITLKDMDHPNDLLSDDELAVLDAVVTHHGHKTGPQLIEYVHTLPEWTTAAHRARQSITYEDILDALATTQAKKRRILAAIAAKRALAAAAAAAG